MGEKEKVDKMIAIYKFIVHGSSMHADYLGLSPDIDEVNQIRVDFYNDMVDMFSLLPKDDKGHVSVSDLKEQQKASWNLFIKLAKMI